MPEKRGRGEAGDAATAGRSAFQPRFETAAKTGAQARNESRERAADPTVEPMKAGQDGLIGSDADGLEKFRVGTMTAGGLFDSSSAIMPSRKRGSGFIRSRSASRGRRVVSARNRGHVGVMGNPTEGCRWRSHSAPSGTSRTSRMRSRSPCQRRPPLAPCAVDLEPDKVAATNAKTNTCRASPGNRLPV